MNEQEKQNQTEIEVVDVNKNQRWDILLKIISVLTAVLIWFWVVGFESQVAQRKFTSIPVQTENLSEMRSKYGYSILAYTEIYIDVTLEGKNSDLNKVKPSQIHAYIDLKGVSQAGEISLPIEIKGIDNVRVFDQSQSSTIVYIDKEISVNLPVEAKIVQMVKEEGVEIEELILTPDVVTVYGPEGVLKNLSRAMVNLSLGAINRSVTVTEKNVILINKNGEEEKNPYIKTNDTINIYVSVTATKELPLTVNYKYGYYNDSNTTVTITPGRIKIRGSPDYINNISDILIGEINEKKYVTDTTITMPVLLPDGVTNLSGISAANVEIKFINTEQKLISVSTRQNANFKITPPKNLEYHIKEDSIQVNFLGPPAKLKNINSSGISVSADLSGLTDKGVHSVPLDISADSYDSVFCVGEYTISVEIY